MRIIELEFNRKRLEVVAGLVWHPLQASGSARTKEMIGLAKAGGFDLKVTRGDEAPHVGLAQKKDGGKAGQIAVAAVIADALAAAGHRSVLVALPLPQKPGEFLYIAVRDNVILADGDSVGSEEQIQQRLSEDKSFGGWDTVICPDDWGVPDAEQRDLDSFFIAALLKRAKQWQLAEVQVDVMKLVVLVAVVAAVSMGSVYGWGAWKKRQALAAAMAEAQRQQQEHEAAARNRNAAAANAVPQKPWPSMPSAPTFAQACAMAFERVGVTAGNWKLDGAACENGQLSVRWVKGGEAAWVSHLRAIRPNAIVAGDGLSATVSMPVTAQPSGDRGEPLLDAMGLRLRYFDLASRYGMSVKIDPPQAPPPPQTLPGQKDGPPPPAPQWAETAVQVTAAFNPVEAAMLLDSPGLRFNKLVFSFTKDGLPQYQFTGVQYVRP